MSRHLGARLLSVSLFSLSLATAAVGSVHAQGAAGSAPPAKAEDKSAAKSSGKPADADSVKENVKQLGREVTDPNTPKRVKAHEQTLEKKVERKRAAQRKDHGAPRPSDAPDLAKSLDKPEQGSGGAGSTKKP